MQQHNGDTAGLAYGEGWLDVQAIFLTIGSGVVALFCCALVPSPGSLQVFAIGILAVPFAIGIEDLAGDWIGRHIGNLARSQGPTILSIVLLVIGLHLITRRAGNPNQRDA